MAAEPKPRFDEPSDEPMKADEREVDAIRKVARLLADSARDDTTGEMRLTMPDGQALDLPASIRTVLRQAVPLLAQGDAVVIASLHKEMTTQEAADFLNISRPSLIKLLENGVIPYVKVGTHRRVRLDDLLSYEKHRHDEFNEFAAWMLAVAQEHNAYD